VITTTDYWFVFSFGSHAAVYIDNNGNPAIYDPAGSYGDRAVIGTGDIIIGEAADLASYVNYHLKNARVSQLHFSTTPEEEAAIFDRALEMGGGFPGLCAVDTSLAIDDIGPFKGLGRKFTPGGLYRALRKLQRELSKRKKQDEMTQGGW
jgi:hypothetical protein